MLLVGVYNSLLEVKQRRRDQFSIVANILEISRETVLKTQIMYRANLSFTQLNCYIPLLLKNQLIAQYYFEGKEVYQITGKGTDFLQLYRELKTMITK
jgi:predicted transcriptional regulator